MTNMSQEHGPLLSAVSSVPTRWLRACNGPNGHDTRMMVSTLVLSRRRAICPARLASQRALPVAAERSLVEQADWIHGVVLLVVVSTCTAGPGVPRQTEGSLPNSQDARWPGRGGKRWSGQYMRYAVAAIPQATRVMLTAARGGSGRQASHDGGCFPAASLHGGRLYEAVVTLGPVDRGSGRFVCFCSSDRRPGPAIGTGTLTTSS